MRAVNNIISITYSELYKRINSIKFSVGALNYVVRMNYDANNIVVSTMMRYTYINECRLQITDFVSACRSSYEDLQYDFDREFASYIDIESFLKVVYPNIDDILKGTHQTRSDTAITFEYPNLNASKLNEFVFNSWVVKAFPSIPEIIEKNNFEIKKCTEELKHAINAIDRANKQNEILVNLNY